MSDLAPIKERIESLSPTESRVFSAWRETDVGMGYNFHHASERSGVDRTKIRRAVRALARKGLLSFYRTGWTDDGEMYGACYVLTEAGRTALSAKAPDNTEDGR